MHFLICQFLQHALSSGSIFIAYHLLQKMSDYLYFIIFFFLLLKGFRLELTFPGTISNISNLCSNIYLLCYSSGTFPCTEYFDSEVSRGEPDASRLRREMQCSPSSIFQTWIFIQVYRWSLESVLPSDILR